MQTISISVELTSLIVLAVGSISWLTGLSFGLKQARKEIGQLQDGYKSLDTKFTEIWKQLSQINVSLAKIEERTSHNNTH